MTRWGVLTLLAIFAVGSAGVFLARVLGASGSRFAALVRVGSAWLAAWILWTFAGGLLVTAGVLRVYDPALFATVTIVGAVVHYRMLVRGAHERARAVFVGIQLAWLLIVVLQNT